MNPARIGVDPIIAVHERLEAHQVIAHREGDCAELHEVMRRLPGRLAIEGDEVERLNRRLEGRPLRRPGIDCIVEHGKGLSARRTESR